MLKAAAIIGLNVKEPPVNTLPPTSPNTHTWYTWYRKRLYSENPEKNTTIKFHENALKQFSGRLKFTNLASEPQKNSNQPFYECIIQVIHRDNFMGAAMFASKSIFTCVGYTQQIRIIWDSRMENPVFPVSKRGYYPNLSR